MTDATTLDEIRSLNWGEDDSALNAVLALAETDDISHIFNSLIDVDRDLLPATLTAHVKKKRPDLLKRRASASGRSSGSATTASKSSKSLSFEEVGRLCLEREEHRKASRYTDADRVRDRLHSEGITLEDKRHMFTMPDGRQGSYNLYRVDSDEYIPQSPSGVSSRRQASPPRHPSQATQGRAPAPTQSTRVRQERQESYRGYGFILERAIQREHARRDKDFARSDALRDELIAEGVSIEDKQHMFTTSSGHQGTYNLQRGVGVHEVQLCCLDREEARRDNDYASADNIRDQLAELGVTLDDKSHTFRMRDGQQGSYDLHSTGAHFDAGPAPGGRSAFAPAPHTAMIGSDFIEIEDMCIARERARRDNDYQTADKLRMQLGNYGVTLDDKTHTFTMVDGRRGSYDLRAQQLGPPQPQYTQPHYAQPQFAVMYPPMQYLPPQYGQVAYGPSAVPSSMAGHSPAAPRVARSSNGISKFSGYHEVLMLAREREEVRRNRDYRESDRLRDNLRQMRVECEDAVHTFDMDGLRGSYDLRSGIGRQEIQYVALEREEARKDRDYAKSDFLRDWLSKQDVQLDDKTHTFTMSDGSSGSYDLLTWSDDQAKRRRIR